MPKTELLEKYFELLPDQGLFHGFTMKETAGLIEGLQGKIFSFQAGEVLSAGNGQSNMPRQIGLLLSGRALHTKYDLWGNRAIIEYIMPGGLLDGIYSLGGEEFDHVQTVAEQECVCLYLTLCTSVCKSLSGWSRLEWNIIGILSRKNRRLFQKVDILSRRTLREKILAYLSYEREIHQSDSYTIPLNRQEMSDYLCVDRTSLSSELGKLRREGLIDFDHSRFELKGPLNQAHGMRDEEGWLE